MNNLTRGPVGRRLFAFVLPTVAGNILQQLYNTVDAVIVGRYIGTFGVAAVGVSMTVMLLQTSLLMGLGIGIEVLVARHVGAEDHTMIKRTTDSLTTAILLLAVLLGIAGYFLTGSVLKLLKTPDEIFINAKTYLQIICVGLPGVAGFNAFNGLIRSTGNSRLPVVFLLLSTMLNIVLDFLMIGTLGMGIGGAAMATVIAQSFSFIACVIYINTKNYTITYHLRHMDFSLKVVFDGLKIGMPASLQHGALSLGMLALQWVVNPLGSLTVAAYTIGVRIDSFAGLPIMNLSSAVTTFTSQNIGAGKIDRVIKARRSSIAYSCVICTIVLALIWIFGASMAGWFTEDSEVIKMTVEYIRVLTVGYFAAAYYHMILAQVRGAGNTLIPMQIVIIGNLVCRVAIAYGLSKVFDYLGVWLSIPIGWVIATVLTVMYMSSPWYKENLTVKVTKKTGPCTD